MILIAPDKFKGHHTAAQVCDIVARKLRHAGYSGQIVCRPLSDGGEGAADLLMPDRICGDTPGIYFSPDRSRCLAVSSEIVGFDAFKGSEIPLMRRSSIALGHAIPQGIPVTIAIGGTAISDGGAGFLQGLGATFYDHTGQIINRPLCPDTLHTIARAEFHTRHLYNISGVVDVHATLTPTLSFKSGAQLSAIDFAPQKALPGEDISGLANALKHFQSIFGGKSPWDGAGGGLGYAIASVLGAACSSGAEAAVKTIAYDINRYSLIITGEGRVDNQTRHGGKLVDEVYRIASANQIHTLVLYGDHSSADYLYPWMAQIDSDWIPRISRLLNL